MSELEDWVDFLYSDQTGYVYAPVRKSISEWTPKFFQWPQEREQLVSWIAVWGGNADVFLAPALFKDKNPVKKSVKGSSVVWAEFDGQAKNLDSVPEPSAIIQSSKENHFHIYWRIPFTPPEAVEDINRRLTYNLGADSSGWDSTQILRPPATINFKRNLPVILRSLVGTLYDQSSFDGLPKVPLAPTAPGIETLPSILKVLGQNKFSGNLLDLIENPKDEVGERSTYLMHVGYCLAEEGLKYEDIVTVLLYADEKAGKFVGRSDRLQRVSEIASRAIHEKGTTYHLKAAVYDTEEILNDDASIEFYWEPFLPREGRLIIASAPGVGKTLLGIDLGFSLALGRDLLGFKIPAPCRSLYVSMEMNLAAMKRHLGVQYHPYNSEEREQIRERFKIIPYGNRLEYEEIQQHISAVRPEVLFLDTLSASAVGGLSGEEEPIRIFQWLDHFREEFGLATVLLHHNRKASDGNKKPNNLDDLYGNFAIGAKVDSALILWRDDKPNSKIQFRVVKSRYAEVGHFYTERDKNLHYITAEKGSGGTINVKEIPKGNSAESSTDGGSFKFNSEF